VAEARHLTRAQVVDLIARRTSHRAWGVLGEDTVNVVDLNIAVDRASGSG